MQPAISSKRFGIETQNQLAQELPAEIIATLVTIIGETLPDHRFWIPNRIAGDSQSGTELIRPAESSNTLVLCSAGLAVKRLEMLQQILSLGFVLNAMYIPELKLAGNVVVTIACQVEPFNFHPRLLIDGNQIDGCSVTFTYPDGSLNSSVQLMIISVICRLCGFSRM